MKIRSSDSFVWLRMLCAVPSSLRRIFFFFSQMKQLHFNAQPIVCNALQKKEQRGEKEKKATSAPIGIKCGAISSDSIKRLLQQLPMHVTTRYVRLLFHFTLYFFLIKSNLCSRLFVRHTVQCTIHARAHTQCAC